MRIDMERVAAAAAAPEHGPRILFFTGGSALRPLCRSLKRYTHTSIHVVTPFDSGGSSGLLRRAFGMPAVGDIRNRLVALSDGALAGKREIRRLLSYRLGRDETAEALRIELDELARGTHPLAIAAPAAVRSYARLHIAAFAARMPSDFDLRGASIGNLVLAGAWLEKPDLGDAIRAMSELLATRGTVLPTVEADLHLAVMLDDGTRVVGQHHITGKERPPLDGTIRDIALTHDPDALEPTTADAPAALLERIRTADLICFPIGSFFSSVLCNVLPRGIGRAVADAGCRKVYVPNMGLDVEQRGLDAADATAMLLDKLRLDAGRDVPAARLLDAVLLDPDAAAYAAPPRADAIAALGVEPILAPLLDATEGPDPTVDPERLAHWLVSLAAADAPVRS